MSLLPLKIMNYLYLKIFNDLIIKNSLNVEIYKIIFKAWSDSEYYEKKYINGSWDKESLVDGKEV